MEFGLLIAVVFIIVIPVYIGVLLILALRQRADPCENCNNIRANWSALSPLQKIAMWSFYWPLFIACSLAGC